MAKWELVFLTYLEELERIEMHESDFDREFTYGPSAYESFRTVWATVYRDGEPYYRVSHPHVLGRGDVLTVRPR